MDERVLQARVGIMVISAVLLTGILIMLFGKFPTPFQQGQVIYVRFQSAPGVTEGTPVRKSGILIGRVEKVAFIEDSPDVMVSIRLKPGTKIYNNEVCRITTGSLLGDAVLEFVPGLAQAKDKKLLEEGTVLKGVVVSNPLETLNDLKGDVQQTLKSVGVAGNEVGRLAQNINKLVEGDDADRVQRVLEKTESAMENFQKAMANINDLVGDEKLRSDLKASLAAMPKLMEDTRSAVAGMQSAVTRADRNMQNLEKLTTPLGERGQQIANNLDSSVAQLDQFMRQLVTFTDRFNNQQGSLSRLMNDPSLYNELQSAAKNINHLTVQMRPILEDVRIFTDKIAREPGRLGVRGALERNAPTKFPNFGDVQPPPLDWREEPPVYQD